jgi:uncharacterized protein (TIGR02145 family)
MKTIIKIILGIFFLIGLYGCPKPDNPYDEDYDPAKWTPSNFSATQQDNSIKLTWTQDEKRIDGFKIDRNVANSGIGNVASPSKTDNSWIDNNIIGGKLHEYILYAYAGNNQSNSVAASATPIIAAIVNTLPVSELAYTSAKLNGSVNANGTSTTVTFMYKKESETEWTSVDASPKTLTSNNLENVSAVVSNLSSGENYVFKIKAVSAAGTVESGTLTFKPPCPPPTVSGVTYTKISPSKVQVDGQVNANGVSTTAKFEYGKTTSYGQSVTATPPSVTGNTLTNVSAVLTGLDGNTKYYYQLVAESCGGSTIGKSIEGFFITDPNCVAPAISNLSSDNITSKSATLHGKVNAQGFSTQVVFEYGETLSLGSFVDASPSTVTGGTPTDVSATITELKAKTTYYWRIVAENCGGETKSDPIQPFETKCEKPTIITASATPTTNSAQLRGQVNANLFPTTVKFEYGETQAYGSSVTASPSTVTGISNTSVSANIYSLKPNANYFGKLVAENCGGKEEKPFTFSTIPCTKPTASITSVTKNTGSSVIVSGEVNASGFTTTVMVDYGKTTSYGLSKYTTPPTVTGISTVSATISGLELSTTYYFRISAENCGGETNSSYRAYTTSNEDEFTDSRDSKKYGRVKIGNQIWMSDNLAYLPLASNPANPNTDANPYYYVYGYTGTSATAAKAQPNYSNYGVLYNWYAARTGCPSGWHLPTDDEWKTLEQYAGMPLSIANNIGLRGTNEGQKLKAASGWKTNTGTDIYKFTALPGGYHSTGTTGFLTLTENGYWWTNSSEASGAWYRRMEYGRNDIYRYTWAGLYYGFSVRCVQNQ